MLHLGLDGGGPSGRGQGLSRKNEPTNVKKRKKKKKKGPTTSPKNSQPYRKKMGEKGRRESKKHDIEETGRKREKLLDMGGASEKLMKRIVARKAPELEFRGKGGHRKSGYLWSPGASKGEKTSNGAELGAGGSTNTYS